MQQKMEYDENGDLVLYSGSYAIKRMEHNENQKVVRQTCYGTDGQLTLSSFGYAIIEFSYDAKAQKTEESYYGVEQEPIVSYEGYHKMVVTNNLDSSEYAYYDTEGNLTNDIYGTARRVAKDYSDTVHYDKDGNQLER